MKGLRSLAATTLALFLVFSLMGNSSSAPQRAAASSQTKVGRRSSPSGRRRKDEVQTPNYLLSRRQQLCYWLPCRNHKKLEKKTLIQPDFWTTVC